MVCLEKEDETEAGELNVVKAGVYIRNQEFLRRSEGKRHDCQEGHRQ